MKKSFTLIELLVVIAIIAILASLLLPSLSVARKTAQKMRCANVLKQYGFITQMYYNDNKENIPNYYHYYLTTDPITFFGMFEYTGYLAKGMNNKLRDVCNSTRTSYQVSIIKTCYGLNTSIVGETLKGPPQVFKNAPYPPKKLQNPSRTWFMADGIDNMQVGYYNTLPSNTYFRLAPVHLDQVNTAFFDGHVETFKLTWSGGFPAGSVAKTGTYLAE